jgi:hypothetical protein
MRLASEKWDERAWTCPDLMRIGLNKHSNRLSAFTIYTLCPFIKKDFLSKRPLNRFRYAETYSLRTRCREDILCWWVLALPITLPSEKVQISGYLMLLPEWGTDTSQTLNLKNTISIFSAIPTKKVKHSCVWKVSIHFRMVTYNIIAAWNIRFSFEFNTNVIVFYILVYILNLTF